MKIVQDMKTTRQKQRLLNQGIIKLEERLQAYDNQDIKKIHDEVLLHDRFSYKKEWFFIYKCRIDKIQLRILVWLANEDEAVVISFSVKDRTNNDYIEHLQNYAKKYYEKRIKV